MDEILVILEELIKPLDAAILDTLSKKRLHNPCDLQTISKSHC